MHSVRRPWWQQATALVTVSTGGAISGFTFVPGAAATVTSPTSVPVHLLALEKAAKPVETGDATLRSAIVNVANYYLRLAQTKTPGQMEALIWGDDSLDGADHGASCAAFASLTLELAAQATGEQSWVTGGSTYPWPLHEWADVRVDENPDSPGITSIVQDAEAHQRWHPLGDGYQPQPGDWVLFDQHVEVVTGYSNGVLDTIGADSLPNLTVNAHTFPDPLAQQGVEGFVDNGHLNASSGTQAAPASGAQRQAAPATGKHAAPATTGARGAQGSGPAAEQMLPDIPGAVAPGAATGASSTRGTGTGGAATPVTQAAPATTTAPAADPAQTAKPTTDPATPAAAPGNTSAPSALSPAAAKPAADIPGDPAPAGLSPSSAGNATAPARGPGSAAHPSPAPYSKHSAPDTATPGTSTQQAFINQIAPGAYAAQQRFGVPASVTIAQAIDESGWGTSQLAATDHNLFGIKGTGPAGSITLPTQEFENGGWVTIYAQFRVYHNVSESISDHAELLATSGYYTRAMADRAVPDAFANDLTGVYATDPDYGSNLIAIMRLYNLYRFDAPPTQAQAPASSAPAAPVSSGAPAQPTSQSPSARPSDEEPSIPGVMAAPSPTPTPATTRPAAAAAPSRTAPAARRASATHTAPTAPMAPAASASGTAAIPGSVTIPAGAGIRTGTAPAKSTVAPARVRATSSRASSSRASSSRATSSRAARGSALVPGLVSPSTPQYQAPLPATVATAYFAKAKAPLARAELLHRDVASQAGIPWQLLAACDWMECHADPRYSPVQGERLGTLTSDGNVYSTKSEALAQVAGDLRELAMAVYGLDLTAPGVLSVRAIADVFAAFRWGGLLRRHRVSAMEFPYSVAGLTAQHQKMHWPHINDPDAPDRPGSRFRMPFGAVPVVLTLKYPATV